MLVIFKNTMGFYFGVLDDYLSKPFINSNNLWEDFLRFSANTISSVISDYFYPLHSLYITFFDICFLCWVM